jgi:hypothetical protein
MSRWYRAYAGTVKDDKLAEVSVIAGCSRSVAIAVWHAILESAAETDDGGRFETTPRRVAAALCEPLAAIQAVFDGMTEIAMIGGDSVTAWKARQYESDKSTERSRKHRETKRNAHATLQGRCATPPETEAETEEQKEGATAPSSGAVAKFDYDLVENQCREAAGLEQASAPGLMVIGPLLRLLEAGATLERDILPVLRAAKAKGQKGSTWTYYLPAIERGLKPPDAVKLIPPQSPDAATVFVEVGTEEWDAWQDHKGKKMPFKHYPEHQAEGWLFPTKWPPQKEGLAA